MSEDIFDGEFDGTAYEGELSSWVLDKCQEWRDYYEANYSEKHDEYMRLYRNQWASEDKVRDSERSKLIAPALAQAVESNVAELEEAPQPTKYKVQLSHSQQKWQWTSGTSSRQLRLT